MPEQQRGDVAVLPAVADERLAEAEPAGCDVGDDPPGDSVAGLLVLHLRHAVHDGQRGSRRRCPVPVMKRVPADAPGRSIAGPGTSR